MLRVFLKIFIRLCVHLLGAKTERFRATVRHAARQCAVAWLPIGGRFTLLTVIFCATGCATYQEHHLSAISQFDAGNAAAALQGVEKAESSRGAEKNVLALDRAMLHLMSGNPRESEVLLRAARDEMDFLSQKDVREETAAMLSDEGQIAWSGREFERRMADSLLTLVNLLDDGGDAFAYASQAIEVAQADRQRLLDDHVPRNDAQTADPIRLASQSNDSLRPPQRFGPNAMASYLYAAVQSERAMNSENTDRAIEQVGFWTSKDNKVARANVFGTRTQRGHGVVHVVTLVGRATDWNAESAQPTSAALLLADRILSATGKHSLPPTVSAVKIARPEFHQSMNSFRTTVQVAGQNVDGFTLVDLNKAAFDSYNADRDTQLARAVARRIIKKGTVYAAKDNLNVSRNSGVDLVINLGGVLWESIEQADTRHWTLLPERIEIAQVELEVGSHTIDLGASTSATAANRQISVPVEVEDGRNTFIVCFRPQREFAGMILTNGPETNHIAVSALAQH